MKLLDKTRLGILILKRTIGEPLGVPVWFDWNGEKLQFFAGTDSQKVKRFQENARVSILVANNVGEPESWIAFDGDVQAGQGEAIDLVTALAHRYWDTEQPDNREKLNSWQRFPEAFVRFEMVPDKIRQGS
jgi:general stress protein 26